MLAMIIPLLLAAAAPSAADRTEIESRVVEIYKPYATEGPPESWDVPVYSAETTALIAKWREVAPTDELVDWFCQCQDWDADAFSATILDVAMASETVVEVRLSIDVGLGGADAERKQRLIFRREDGVWKLDEMFADAFPNGLQRALRETIAEALRARNAG
jgi:hypothetical protein